MSYPQVEVRYGSINITNLVIDYTREQSICTGIGTLKLTLTAQDAPSFSYWDVIKLYEDGIQKGLYRIQSISKTHDGKLLLECQDNSIRLTDYFIPEQYQIDSPTYTRYWIEKFLSDAGVTYNFTTTSQGNLVNENTTLGVSSAYDTIMLLLQMSGWYMYFDNDGTCIIGDLNADLSSPQIKENETSIINISQHLDDSFLRNRAVVWGNANKDREWVLADVRRPTPWDRNSRDIRTVLFSSSGIRSTAVALSFCYKILDEFAHLKNEKTVTLAGFYDVSIGDVAYIESRVWSGKGLITTLRSSVSNNGFVTEIVLDEKCPKLLGYYGFVDYVYTGHAGAGVWRKFFDDTIWESFSDGLEDYNVTDLIVKNGIFACVAGGNLYTRTSSTSSTWTKYDSNLVCEAVDIDTHTNNIYAVFRLSDSDAATLGFQRSYVHKLSPLGKLIEIQNIYFSVDDTLYQDFEGRDIARTDDNRILVTAIAPASYGLFSNPSALFGERNVLPNEKSDPKSFVFGPTANDSLDGGYVISVGSDPYGIFGGHILFKNNIALSMDQYNRFTWFNYKKYPEEPYYLRTRGLRNFPIYFPNNWPSNTDRLIYRYLYWDGNTDKDTNRIYIIDWIDEYPYKSYYKYNVLELGGLVDYENAHIEYYNYVSDTDIIPSGVQVVDGYTTSTGDVIALIGQDDPKDNGIYIASDFYNWVRNSSWIPSSGLIIQAKYGSNNAGRCWQLRLDDNEEIVLGTTELKFQEVLNVISIKSGQAFDLNIESKGSSGDILFNVTQINKPFFIDGKLHLIAKLHFGENDSIFNTKGKISWVGFSVDYNGNASKKLIYEFNYNLNQPDVDKIVDNLLNVPCGKGVGVVGARITGTSHKIFKVLWDGNEGTYKESTIFTTNSMGDLGGCVSINPQISSTVQRTKLAYTGYTFLGEYNEAWFRITMLGGTYFYNEDCLHCGKWGSHFTEKAAIIHGQLLGDNLFFEPGFPQERYNYLELVQCKPLDPSMVCCNTSATHGSIDLSSDLDYNSILGLIGRWGPIYLYNFSELRDSVTDNVVHVLEHICDGSEICRQTDDFDGGVYIVKPYPYQRIYKEIPGIGTVAIITVSGNPGLHFGNQMFAHGVFMTTTFNEGVGPTKALVLDKDHILNGLELCYLLEDEKDNDDNPTGQYIIRDFDFYAFATEDSQPEPLISWTYPPMLSTYTFNGITYSGLWPENMKVHRTLNKFKGIPVSGMFNDGRTFTFTGTTPSGVNLDYGVMALMATRNPEVLIMPTETVSGLSLYTVASGIMYSLETTNRGTNPWIFLGTTQPIGFEQKDSGEDTFEQQPGFPGSDILVIRTDDRI